MTLSATQVKAFRSDGLLVVEDMIPPAKLAAMHDEYAALAETLYADWEAEGLVPPAEPGWGLWDHLDRAVAGGFDWYQPFDISLPHENIRHDTPMHFGQAAFDIITEPRLLDAMEALLGPEITSNPIQHIRIKPPARSLPEAETRAHVSATHWHQDKGVGLPDADQSRIITVWLAITNATIENGCLQVLKRRPDGLLPHCPKSQMTIADGFIDPVEAVPVPVRAGSAILMDSLMPHSSLANLSGEYRWSMDLRFNVTGDPTGRDQFPAFIARSRRSPGIELRDWRVWRRLWQDARAHLSTSPHIPQHRWPAGAPHCA